MPLISVSGAQGVGKTTFINDFLIQYPTYTSPTRTYRDIIKEKGLDINKETTESTQKIILDAIIESMSEYTRGDNVIFDRSPLDNLVYSIWAFDKDVGDFTEEFVADCITICKQAMQRLDLMLFIPVTKLNNIEEMDTQDGTRELDPVYQKEINELFVGLKHHRDIGDDTYFQKGDCSPIIEIFGNRSERLGLVQLYLNEDGGFFGEEDSLILDANGDSVTDKPDSLIDTGDRDLLRKELGIGDEPISFNGQFGS
jgi:predicted ATPase